MLQCGGCGNGWCPVRWAGDMSYVGACAVPLSDAEKSDRMAAAMLASLDDWISQLGVIEQHATLGNKGRSLHLLGNLMQTRMLLRKLSGLPEE